MEPIHISGDLWHQPTREEVKSFVYITGDPEDKEDITAKILDKLLWILDNETYSRGELKGVVAVIDRLFREELVPMTEEDWQDLFAVTERSLRRIDKSEEI